MEYDLDGLEKVLLERLVAKSPDMSIDELMELFRMVARIERPSPTLVPHEE